MNINTISRDVRALGKRAPLRSALYVLLTGLAFVLVAIPFLTAFGALIGALLGFLGATFAFILFAAGVIVALVPKEETAAALADDTPTREEILSNDK